MPTPEGFTKVRGTKGVYLLPTRTGSGSEEWRRGGMEYAIADQHPVRQLLGRIADRAEDRARGILGLIRAKSEYDTNWVEIDKRPGDIDYYLILNDTKGGMKGAMSIEYGRDSYQMETEDGEIVEIEGMEGKAILHRAFGLALGALKGTGGGKVL